MFKTKIISVILIIVILICGLCSCERSYHEAKTLHDSISWGHEYFTMIKAWSDSGHDYYILYANDTKVLYFVSDGSYGSGITPLYNANGTLQVYDEELMKLKFTN